jgi:hypothetical protein
MSPLVSPAQISALQTVAYRGLDSSATVIRPIQVETDFGSDASWATVSIDTPCWIRGVNIVSTIISTAMRESVVGVFRIHFEQDTDIDHGDRVIIGDSTYDIIDINVENTIQIFRTALGKKIE